MKVDLKIVSGVVFFTLIAVGVLALVRWSEVGQKAEMSAPMIVQLAPPKGLDVTVTASEVTLGVKACNIDKLGDEFFLHLYPTDATSAGPEGFVNQQFNLKTLTPIESSDQAGVASCHYRVKISSSDVKRVAVGQFRAPEGRCCEILWTKEVKLDE
ncbi:hypothetical protein [Pseudomonas hamedanensis]|uniref:hypothetical protein n=1 Tax=Pseudomonas hamedanensis TaxID=2745504 RepID=UPI001CEC65C3|nr:hypothetical protein [Pseudomonas hamedanensis]